MVPLWRVITKTTAILNRRDRGGRGEIADQMAEPHSQAHFTDSAELYAACSSVDPLIQARGYESLWAYLYRVALHVVRDQPEASALAQDCAQTALVRIHASLSTCREPAAFHIWARRIVSHIAIDELRRRKRLTALDGREAEQAPAPPQTARRSSLEAKTLNAISQSELYELINQAPISDRSRRVVLGRYFDGHADERLAQVESELAERAVLPSHIQVTRAKNIAKLRQWQRLRDFMDIKTED